MKEIIYVQAGRLANHIGTHFWNTQESYFTYGEDEEPHVDHDVSFREGLTLKGESTYCPRLLLFDRKANFGTLSNELYGRQEEEEAAEDSLLWGGDVVEYRQDRIPKSDYQKHLDSAVDDEDGNSQKNEHNARPSQFRDEDVRYWSDFSRVFFHPRSLQKLPDPADWENAEGDWMAGKGSFERHHIETDLMDESLRLFVEECDNLQGMQVMNDTSTFGGFTDAFITSFRDEFPKLPCLSFPLLSSSVPGHLDADNDLAMRKAINDALVIRGLDVLSTMSVPIQAPELWAAGDWLDGINLNRKSLYHTSAILSSQTESATLPLRLKGSTDELAGVCGMLNWGGNVRVAQLSGMFPLSSPLNPERDFLRRIYDFSMPPSSAGVVAGKLDTQMEYSRIYVTRGFSSFDRRQFDQWNEPKRPLPYSIYAPAYPIPSSFPSFFTSAPTSSSSARGNTDTPTVRALSSIHTTPHTAHLLATYATLVDDCIRRRPDVLSDMGLEKDEVNELRDDLWALRDTHAGAEDGEVVEEELGEDEE